LIGIAIPIIISLIIYESEEKGESRIEVLLLQPNIDPYEEKYERNNRYFFDLMIQMVSKQITEKTRYIFTPETYFASGLGEPLDDFNNCQLYRDLDSLLQRNPKIQLISGIQSFNIYQSKKKPSSTANEMKNGYWIDFYNSALKMQSNSQHEFYHKSKLVVGVENMPYKSFFKPFLGQFLIDLGGTVSSRVTQKERTVFKHKTEGLNVGPIICYESIYGSFVTEYIRKGADFLAIITNDAWWGNTAGHRQLLSYSRLRAIENRRSIVRSANTGISAIINKKGELIDKLPYNHRSSLRGYFSTAKEITFYTQYGDYIARLSCLMMILFFLLAVSGRLKPNSSKK
jgi:apolipoprotein N-acyltransferase